jgi:hypothetical protein
MHHLRQKAFPPCYPLDHLPHLGAREAAQRQLGEVGPGAPGHLKVRSCRHQQPEAGGRHLVEQQAQPLQRGRIDPVQVFDDQQDRLLCGQLEQQD